MYLRISKALLVVSLLLLVGTLPFIQHTEATILLAEDTLGADIPTNPNKTTSTELSGFDRATNTLTEDIDLTVLPGPELNYLDVFNLIIRFLAGVVGGVVLIRLMMAGLKSMSGKEADIGDRNAIIVNAIAGLAIVMLSGLIATGFLSIFWSGGQSSNVTSILPTGDTLSSCTSGTPSIIGDVDTCPELRALKKLNPSCYYSDEFRTTHLSIINTCGAQTLGDISYFVKNIIAFLYNVFGTLFLIALMIAGFTFVFSKDKESAEGKKAVQRVFTGAMIAILAIPIMQVVLGIIDAFFQ